MCGPDKIFERYGLFLAPAITPYFCHKTGNMWPLWQSIRKETVNVHPIIYRPISLTCVCYVLELIICSSISSHWEAYNTVREEQHGFQQGN